MAGFDGRRSGSLLAENDLSDDAVAVLKNGAALAF